MVAPRCFQIMALVSLGFSGCAASLQDYHYALVNKTRAEYSWYSKTSFGDRWNAGSDYAYGYKSGFYDASTGKGCTLPAVPPPCYWSTKYQCCEGQKHIQDWYRGYQCGVAAAQGTGYPSFHDVPIGPQAPVINKDGCGGCYAPTGCLCENTVEEPAVTDLPAIPHLSTSASGLAANAGTPIYQASATANVGASESLPGLGLIGPVGSAPTQVTTAFQRSASSGSSTNTTQPMIR